MGRKILKITAIILLGIIPYSSVLSGFSPYWTTHSFLDYIVASLAFAFVSLVLGWIVSDRKLFVSCGFFFFLLGIFTAPAFMIGPPELTPKLLERTTEEHFRYGLLLLSSIVFAIGFVWILRKYWKTISSLNKFILVPFVGCFVLLIWDNVTSYHFSAELIDWNNAGNDPELFFLNYDFQEFWRTLGRSLIYILIPWLACILFEKGRITKGLMIFLSLFSILGMVFFFLTNGIGMQYYFPFMVPAIALAPAYWLGIALLNRPD